MNNQRVLNDALADAVATRLQDLDSLSWFGELEAEQQLRVRQIIQQGEITDTTGDSCIIVLAGMLTFYELLAQQADVQG